MNRFSRWVPVLSILLLLCLVPSVTGSELVPTTNLVVTCSSPLNLSPRGITTSLPQEESDPVISGSNIYAAWTNDSLGTSQVFFSVSNNSGLSFKTILLDQTPTHKDQNPRIAVWKGNVYVVWQDTFSSLDSIYFAFSHNKGSSFSIPMKLASGKSSGTISNPDWWLPQVSVVGKNIYVVWTASNSTQSDIYFRASHDGGKTFQKTTVNLSDDPLVSLEPTLASSGSDVYVAWVDSMSLTRAIVFRASQNNGSSFGQKVIVSNGTFDSREPILAAGGSHVYITWRDDQLSNYNIYVAASGDFGSIFVTTKVSQNIGFSRESYIVSSGPNVYVIWRDQVGGHWNVLFSASHNYGSNFQAVPTILGGTSGIRTNAPDTDRPVLATSGPHVFASWDDNITGNYEVFLSASSNNGTTFGAPFNVSHDPGVSNSMTISASGKKASVLWVDNSTGTQLILTSICS